MNPFGFRHGCQYTRGMHEATLEFNQWQQNWELKALNRRTGRDSIKVYEFHVRSPADGIRENWSLLDDLNFNLSSWGWRPLTLADWHGTNQSGWAAALTASE